MLNVCKRLYIFALFVSLLSDFSQVFLHALIFIVSRNDRNILLGYNISAQVSIHVYAQGIYGEESVLSLWPFFFKQEANM